MLNLILYNADLYINHLALSRHFLRVQSDWKQITCTGLFFPFSSSFCYIYKESIQNNLPCSNSLKISFSVSVFDNIWLHSAHHFPLPLFIELCYKYCDVKQHGHLRMQHILIEYVAGGKEIKDKPTKLSWVSE